MPSFVWGRDPQEAFEEPYEYDGQAQFAREAETLFARLYRLLNDDSHSFTIDDRTADKAIWLLAMDTLDSLRDCLSALARKNHRVAGKLFRDVRETMDLAAYFAGDDPKARSSLKRWYLNEVIAHSEYRDYVERTQGEAEKEDLKRHYSSLSHFTHRTYRVILAGYLRARGDRLAHDGSAELYRENPEHTLVLPQTISAYYAALSNVTLEFLAVLPVLGLVTSEAIREAFANSVESEFVPRRFMPARWLAERMRESSGKSGPSS